jgi:hypothetical protein
MPEKFSMPAENYVNSIDELAEREAKQWLIRHGQPLHDEPHDEPAESKPQRLQPVDLNGLMERPAALPRFAIGGLVPRRHVTLLSAHGGMGKSCLGLVWCAHVACGHTWAGLTVRGPGKAVFVSLEDEADLVLDRLRRIVNEYRLDTGMVTRNVRVFDGTAGDAALVMDTGSGHRLIPTDSMAELEAAADGATLIVVDNASDGYDGEENNRRQVRTFVRHLAQLARQHDTGMLLLAHVDKDSAKYGSNGNSYSGSTAWHNSARSRLALIETDGTLELRQEKLNLGRRADPIGLKFTEHGVLVPGRIDPEEANAGADLVAAQDAEQVLEVLRLAIAEGITVPTATAGPVTSWHSLQPLPELEKHFRDKDGRRRVAAALVKLSREKRIVRAEYRKADRHTASRWELPQSAADE